MAEAVHRYEYGTESKSHEWFWEKLLQTNEQLSVQKDYGEWRKHRDIKPVTNNKRRCHLGSEANYHTTKYVSEKLLAKEINKAEKKMTELVHLGLWNLDTSNVIICEYWYDYANLKSGDKAKLCYTNMNSFIVHVKSEDVYAGLAGDVAKRFDTSNYEVERPLPVGKEKKVIKSIKDEWDGKIIKEFVAMMRKMCSYLMNGKRKNSTKKCLIKRQVQLKDNKNCLENNTTILRPQQKFRSEAHNVFTEIVDRISLSANNDKRIQTLDGVTTHSFAYALEEYAEQNWIDT